jgi:hypothetical protein
MIAPLNVRWLNDLVNNLRCCSLPLVNVFARTRQPATLRGVRKPGPMRWLLQQRSWLPTLHTTQNSHPKNTHRYQLRGGGAPIDLDQFLADLRSQQTPIASLSCIQKRQASARNSFSSSASVIGLALVSS